jgi:hypothetical protein
MRRLALVLLIVGFAALTTASVSLASGQGWGAALLAAATSQAGNSAAAGPPTLEIANGTAPQGGSSTTNAGSGAASGPIINPGAPTRELAEGVVKPGSAPSSHRPNQPPAEQRLATLESYGFIPEAKPLVAENDPLTVAIKQHLDSLANKCGEDPDQLADQVVATQNSKAKHGAKGKPSDIVAAVDGAALQGAGHGRCTQLFAQQG